MKQCAICQGSFSEQELQFHEQGQVCGMCALESEGDLDAVAAGGATKPLIAAVIATGLGNAVSMRSKSTDQISFRDKSLNYGRHNYSADIPPIVGGGLGVIIAIMAIVMGLKLGSDVSRAKKLGLVVVSVLVLLWAGYTLYMGIPYTEEYGNWPENPRL